MLHVAIAKHKKQTKSRNNHYLRALRHCNLSHHQLQIPQTLKKREKPVLKQTSPLEDAQQENRRIVNTVNMFADRKATDTILNIRHSIVSQDQQLLVVNSWLPQLRNIYVISIRAIRYKNCLKRLGGLSKYVSKVDSCNGNTINMKEWIKKGICVKKYRENCYLRRGQLGCFQSHRNAWKKLLLSNEEHAFILEDDVALYPHTLQHELLQKAFTQIVQNNIEWDVMFIGRNSRLCQKKRKLTENIIEPGITWGLFAYVLNRKAAEHLYNNSLPMHVAVDTWIASEWNQKHLKFIAISPIVCTVVNVVSDTSRIT